MKAPPTAIIDSREQLPFDFENLPSEIGTLDTGDYTICGMEHLVAVERKSLPDLLMCIGRERDRFRRELQRLQAYKFRFLVIESTVAEIEDGQWRSQILPSHVLGSLAAWTAQYELPIWLSGNHAAAGQFVERFLIQSARSVVDEYRAAGEFLQVASGPQEVGAA